MLTTATRLVTGHDGAGRSVVLERASLSGALVDPRTGEGAADIWITPTMPETLGATGVRTGARFVLKPPRGGLTTRLFAVAPGETKPEDFAAARAATRAVYAAIDGADALVDSDRHHAMHRTDTLDVVVVIQGELTLILDDEEAVLRPGDSVVQRATSHAWANRGDELAVAVVVLIDAATSSLRTA